MEFDGKGKEAGDKLNKCWTYLVLALIGEQFDDGRDICGAVVSIRGRRNRIQLWVRDASPSNSTAVRRIGAQLKKTIEIRDPIQFGPHEEKFASKAMYEV